MTAGLGRTAGTGGGTLEPARVATAPVRPGVARLARVARPVAGMGSLLLVEILSNPRARAVLRGLVRSLGRRLAPRTVPGCPVTADRSVMACQVIVVEESAVISVLVRCVETALAVPVLGEPPRRAVDDSSLTARTR
jgi:hypothetical protein